MHISFARSALLCAFSLILLAGCQNLIPPNFPSAPTAPPAAVEPSPTIPPAPTALPTPTIEPTSVPAGADLALLREATYLLESARTGSVTLVDGEYREPSAVVSAAETEVRLFKVVPGDLNQDGIPDAVVVLNVSTGGTGRFSYLYAAIAQDGNFSISAPVYLGDRVIINLLEVAQGEIHLDMVVSGPNDPMCCPSTPASTTYRYQDGGLVNKQP